MRESDVQEIWASNHVTPYDALVIGMEESAICLTVSRETRPVAMFGANPECFLGHKAVIWMLATDEIKDIKYVFAKHSKKFIETILQDYRYLYNWVDCRNVESIEWLKYCGAKLYPSMQYGIEQRYFHYFEFKRG